MKKKRKVFYIIGVLFLLIFTFSLTWAGSNARRPAILAGADCVYALQRTDSGWEGTWYWIAGLPGNATNLTGVTALGLLEAYNDTKDENYLNAAEYAAGFIITHLGAGATGTQYHVRTTAPDVVFLHKLAEVTEVPSYSVRANLEWTNLTSFWPTAGDLDTLFRAISRPSIWDIAFFLEAAYLSGDTTWANDAAAIISDTSDTFYYDTGTFWYPLNLAGAIRALVTCGYYSQYSVEISEMLIALIGLIDDDNGVGGWVQDTAYTVMALNSIGGAARKYANSLGRWLSANQEESGGWIEPDGNEYPEADGEALRALSCTIGSNITIDGFEPGAAINSSWRKALNSENAEPFNVE